MAWVLAGVVASLLPATQLQAQDKDPTLSPKVTYTPSLTQVQGQLPVVRSFIVSIKSPPNLSSGVQVPVTFQITPNGVPSGLPSGVDTTAYVSIATPGNPNQPLTALVFNQPDQSLDILVKVSIPASAMVGPYGYKILAVGFPVDPGLGLSNDGTFINATVTAAGVQPPPPTVTLSLSHNSVAIADGGQVSIPFGSTAVIDFSTTAMGTDGYPITGFEANLGTATAPFTAGTGAGTIGTDTTVVRQGQLQISAAGLYTLSASATNSGGTANTTQTFRVVVANAPVPRAFIDAPPLDSYTVAAGGQAAFDAALRAETDSPATLQGWTAVLTRDGSTAATYYSSINTSQISAISWSGTVPVALSIPGRYTLTLTVRNEFASATTAKPFRIIAAPTISWSPAPITYGTPLATSSDGRLNAIATVGGISVNGNYAYTLASGAAASGAVLPVGTHQLTVTFTPTGTTAEDYTSATKTVSLVVNKAPLTVRAEDKTKVYGSVNPQLTATLSGFVNNETASVVTGSPQLATDAVTGSPVGNYPITPSLGSLSAANYSFGFVNGTLSVTKAVATVALGNLAQTYNGTPRVVTTTTNPTGLGVVVTYGAAPGSTSAPINAGSYAVVATINDNNYQGSTSGTLVVAKANQTITFAALPAKNVGDPAFALTATASSGLAVTYTSSETAVATISGSTVTIVGAGVTMITARQTGNTNFNAAPSVAQNLSVGSGQVIKKTIHGEVFFDVDFDGHWDCSEFGLDGVLVKLLNSANQVVATDLTDCHGAYALPNIVPGTYTLVAVAPAGLAATTLNERTVTVSTANVCVPDIGFGLNFAALRSMTANGFTIGYWKNNLDKAIAKKTSGTQVSRTTLLAYTARISDFALSSYDDFDMQDASTTMAYNGSKANLLLSKQLIASEYNYQNGAYLNGNKNLTMCFLWWGEYVLSNPSGRYSNAYLIWAKDWFDAYNNSHGGVVAGPPPP